MRPPRNPPITALKPERIDIGVLPWMEDVCTTIEKQLVDNQPGISEETIDRIKQTLDDYQKILNLKREKITLSEKRIQDIKSRIPNADFLSEETCAGTVRLLQALASLLDYLHRADELEREGKSIRKDVDIQDIKLGAQANTRFLNFFLSMQKEYGLDLKELTELYTQIFHKTSLMSELKMIDIQYFPPGILAAVRAFWFLKQTNYQDAQFHVPTIEEDMYNGVDLVCEREDEKGDIAEQTLFQIKGRNKGGDASLFDVSDLGQIAKLKQTLKEQNLPEWDYEHHMAVLGKLIAYRDKLQREKPYPVKAFWVEVLMEY